MQKWKMTRYLAPSIDETIILAETAEEALENWENDKYCISCKIYELSPDKISFEKVSDNVSHKKEHEVVELFQSFDTTVISSKELNDMTSDGASKTSRSYYGGYLVVSPKDIAKKL